MQTILITPYAQESLRDPVEYIGCVPDFFDENDPRSAREQVEAKYIGGWRDLNLFELTQCMSLRDKSNIDPPLYCIAAWAMRDELIMLFEYAWVCILAPDGSYTVSRCD